MDQERDKAGDQPPPGIAAPDRTDEGDQPPPGEADTFGFGEPGEEGGGDKGDQPPPG